MCQTFVGNIFTFESFSTVEMELGIRKKKKNRIVRVMSAKSLQSCPILCDPLDSNLPGFYVHGILQARVLEWVGLLGL